MREKSTLGQRIAQLRIHKNLTQRNLMDILNFDNLGKYEKDTREPKLDILIQISNYFEVSLDWLITGKEFNNNTKSKCNNIENLYEITNEEIQIIKLFRQLNHKDKDKIEGIIEYKVSESKDFKKEKSSSYQNGNIDKCIG